MVSNASPETRRQFFYSKHFEDGEISAEDEQKIIWASEHFMEHKLDNFHSRFNKAKKNFAIQSC